MVSSDEPERSDEDTPQGVSSAPSTSPTPPDSTDKGIIASSITSSTAIGEAYQIDIYALERVGEDLIRLRFGVTNNSGRSYFFDDSLGGIANPYTGGRITLLDAVNKTRHLSLNQSDGSCFCSTLVEDIQPGETAEMWVIFPEPPPEVEAMTITTPITPPIFDIPISNSSETVENSGLSKPEIIPLTMISDDTADNTGRTESGDEVSIILSSDVLFETNSSQLNSNAEEILEQVAQEINDASSTVVKVDGYADNTGSDNVNIPLSEDRAKAVEAALSELVSREGVAFEVEGHGSADPIGDNDTEEGRERNRRVSVTFEK
ncbi:MULTISPECIES: OmpA family protein [unclassified Nocardiopsis]|uniref:OmpA family protein n=1 Tax=unclassified Nocardiopsis TaxID=2649073 RepID=UPI001F212903|nr:MULTISPECIES: OmpA family protein [unclassified Nocardiopsis]